MARLQVATGAESLFAVSRQPSAVSRQHGDPDRRIGFSFPIPRSNTGDYVFVSLGLSAHSRTSMDYPLSTMSAWLRDSGWPAATLSCSSKVAVLIQQELQGSSALVVDRLDCGYRGLAHSRP